MVEETCEWSRPPLAPQPCLESEPCSIEDALSNAEGLANGDTVVLAAGTYTPAGELSVFRLGVTIEGEPGEPAPLIEAAGDRGLFLQNIGTVRDLRIHSTFVTSYGLLMTREGSVVERVESTGEAASACGFGEVTVKDTLCATSVAGGVGVLSSLAAGSLVRQEPQLYNVTAVGSIGIEAIANEFAQVRIEAFNTIARGSEYDIFANSEAPPTSEAEVTISHSNFTRAGTAGNGETSLPSANGNQSASPDFVDEAAGDFREAPGSPTINAGATTYPVGALDLAGAARTITCEGTAYVDIGAYELGQCPPPPPPVGNSSVEVIKPPAIVPALSNLTLKPKRFAVSGRKKGTTIAFVLSEWATVKLEVLGRKIAKGKKPKTVTLGTLPVVHGTTGLNQVKFNGKVKGKTLAPGRYTLRATASAEGQTSAPLTGAFQVSAPAR